MTGRVWRNLHLVFTVVWALLLIPTLLWWKDSVMWVAIMSCYANVAAHWSAFQASSSEEVQERDNGAT